MSALLIFYIFAALITLCSVMVIISRNPVTSAVSLVFDLFLLAGLYAMMEAHFVAVIQILLYAGAITVLFMFVIMLLNLRSESLPRYRIPVPELGVLAVTIIGFTVIAILVASGEPAVNVGELTPERVAAAGGNTYAVGMVLFTKYVWPFELASILILLAIIASVVIAKRKKPTADSGNRRPLHGTR